MSDDDGHKDERKGSLASFGGGAKVRLREESWKVRSDHATVSGAGKREGKPKTT
jgi:hypothetical protein